MQRTPVATSVAGAGGHGWAVNVPLREEDNSDVGHIEIVVDEERLRPSYSSFEHGAVYIGRLVAQPRMYACHSLRIESGGFVGMPGYTDAWPVPSRSLAVVSPV